MKEDYNTTTNLY